MNHSIFNYSLTSDSFEILHTQDNVQWVPEKLVANLTNLFNTANATHNSTDIELFRDTCENNTACLLAIARTDNVTAGKLVMEKIFKETYEKELSGEYSSLLVPSSPYSSSVYLCTNLICPMNKFF